MGKTEIRCPSCSKIGYVNVSDERLKTVTRGLLAVNIASNTICNHCFIVYIDKNCNVRDYFVADFQVEIPEMAPVGGFDTSKIPSKDIIDIDLIKLNLPAMLVGYVLKAIFSKTKAIVIIDYLFLKNHIINFFKYITQDSFATDIEVMTEEEYKDKSKKYKDYLAFKGNEIVKNFKKLIDPKKLKVEKSIVNRFLTEPDIGFSYIVLKNEVHKAFTLSKSIVEYANNYAKINNINPEEVGKDVIVVKFFDHFVDKEKLIYEMISNYLIKVHNVKIQKYYLTFLVEIVENYFELNVFNKITIIPKTTV